MRVALGGLLVAAVVSATTAGAQSRRTSAPAPGANGPSVSRRLRRITDAVEVDHLFLWVRPGAPEAAALRAFGLRVMDEPTHHAGNGTSSVSVFFENRYLELIYPDSTVSDDALTAAERAARPRQLHWRESRASPIGIGLRPRASNPGVLPFPTEARTLPWLRPGTALRFVTTAADSLAPTVWVMPAYIALPGWIGEARADTAFAVYWHHPIGARRISGVRVVVANAAGIPPQLQQLADAGVVRIERGADPLLELTLDGGGRGSARDFRPALPLIIRY